MAVNKSRESTLRALAEYAGDMRARHSREIDAIKARKANDASYRSSGSAYFIHDHVATHALTVAYTCTYGGTVDGKTIDAVDKLIEESLCMRHYRAEQASRSN